jgi:hypothetical protein
MSERFTPHATAREKILESEMVTVKITSPQQSASAPKESNTHIALPLLVLFDVMNVIPATTLRQKSLVTNRY